MTSRRAEVGYGRRGGPARLDKEHHGLSPDPLLAGRHGGRVSSGAAGGTLPESFHAAGPTDGGFLIAAVYDSKEACDRFVRETLMPLMPIDGGLVGPPQERGAEIITAS
jgi:hypothetical protein